MSLLRPGVIKQHKPTNDRRPGRRSRIYSLDQVEGREYSLDLVEGRMSV